MILTYQSMSMSLLIRSLSNLVTVKNMRLYIWVLRLDYIKGQFLVRNVQTRVIIRFSQIWKAKIQPNFWFRLESFGHICLQLHLDEVTMEGTSRFHPKNMGPFCLLYQWKFKHIKCWNNTCLRHFKQQQLTFMAILCKCLLLWNEIRHLIFWPKMGNSAHSVRLRLRPRATERPPLLLSLRLLFRLHWS